MTSFQRRENMANDSLTWDLARVRKKYANDDNARVFLDKMAERRRAPHGNVTTVDFLQEECGITRAAALDVLRTLAESGCGLFRIGRRGQPSRIVWDISPIAVAQAARERETAVSPSPPRESGQTEYVEQRIQLRTNVAAIVKVPNDMRKDEAERLAGIVRNIWFVDRDLG
jgi:hypothetical protein